MGCGAWGAGVENSGFGILEFRLWSSGFPDSGFFSCRFGLWSKAAQIGTGASGGLVQEDRGLTLSRRPF